MQNVPRAGWSRWAGCRSSFVRVSVFPLKLQQYLLLISVARKFDDEHRSCIFLVRQVMIDPVVCEDGHSYERGALEAWLMNHDTSPMSNARLNSTMVVPNHALRNSIEAWRRMRGY